MAVPIQSPPPPSYSEQAVRRMEAERKLLTEERYSGWAIVWTLFGFKMATIAVILIVGRHSAEAGSEKSWAYIISTTWYWFIIPLVAFSGFVAWRLRLRKARKQAQLYRRGEFSIMNTSDLAPLTDEEKKRLSQLRGRPEQDR